MGGHAHKPQQILHCSTFYTSSLWAHCTLASVLQTAIFTSPYLRLECLTNYMIMQGPGFAAQHRPVQQAALDAGRWEQRSQPLQSAPTMAFKVCTSPWLTYRDYWLVVSDRYDICTVLSCAHIQRAPFLSPILILLH